MRGDGLDGASRIGARLGRLAAATRFALRHPRRAYQLISDGTASAVAPGARPAEPSTDDERFASALHLLTGLDVTVSFDRRGVHWTVAPGEDGIGEELFARGVYGGETVEAITAFLTDRRPGGRWIIDVGANIGTTAIPFAARGFDVLAIEPVPTTVQLLRHNLEANELSAKVRVVEAAISAHAGEVVIAVSTSLGNSEVLPVPTSTAAFEGRYGRAATISVPAMTLADVVRQAAIDVGDIGLVWSDTQGSDVDVIETGAPLWKAGVPLLAEFWLAGLATRGGVDSFVRAAEQHFRSFVHADNGGFRIARRDEQGRLDPVVQPVTELASLEVIAANYPGGFTDVLLLP